MHSLLWQEYPCKDKKNPTSVLGLSEWSLYQRIRVHERRVFINMSERTFTVAQEFLG